MIPYARHFAPPRPFRSLMACCLLLFALSALTGPVQAADRDRITAFLNITGFDVALDSIALSAANAPVMLGMQADEFGNDWNRLVEQVFDTEIMRGLAKDILEATLSDSALDHAVGFYASDLGQRLVVVENAAHMIVDRDAWQQSGQEIVADLVQTGSPRLEIINRMNRAASGDGAGVRALQEIQLRFLLAADSAGVIDLRMDADGLRALMQSQEAEMRRAIAKSALAGAAYTYRDFSDADLELYAEALEHPKMRQVYELLNAVQYEIMANRFEVLATRMADLYPSQDI